MSHRYTYRFGINRQRQEVMNHWNSCRYGFAKFNTKLDRYPWCCILVCTGWPTLIKNPIRTHQLKVLFKLFNRLTVLKNKQCLNAVTKIRSFQCLFLVWVKELGFRGQKYNKSAFHNKPNISSAQTAMCLVWAEILL